nr:class I SAM-dependent methyltransferase [Synechococcus sp. AH-551-E02]
MYEENPYPRFKFAGYTDSELAKPIFKAIELETSRKDLSFSDELKSLTSAPKVLIAGCGTGNQVIGASRYKNARITAIDLSSSSLAYATRKSMEYGMDNVMFKQIDLLNVADLGEIFDIIECSGVLHHMEKPSKGLYALIQQLKPGGYIKLGLYSEITRKVIVKARKTIQTLGTDSTPEGIRRFRKQVLNGEINQLLDLPKFGRDFYSLSECRDLCFHVQEHRFTTDSLQKLLDSHGLTFCGFMVPDQIKKLYQEIYPDDSDMTSLSNWGAFEEEHPSTFVGMYQFWAQK